MPRTTTAPHPVDEVLPLRRMIPLGTQHVFVMAASPISAVFLVSQTLSLSPALTVNLLSATFILSGLGTILQSWGPWKFGARLPFVMLPGGAPIVLFLGIAKEYDIRTAVGAVILSAVFYFVALPLFARLLKYFPTVVIGTMIVIIGVNLIRVSGLLVTGQPGSPTFGQPSGIILALVTIGFTVLFFRVLRGGLAQLSVLLGLVAGTVVAFVAGAAGGKSGVTTGPVLSVPAFLPFGAPTFDIVAAIPLMIFSIASMAEATGQTVVNAEIVGKQIDVRRSASRTIRGDGLTSLVGGLFGTPLMVTSGENIGIVRVSGVRSRFVTLTAGVILIVIGIVAPIGRIISLIPAPVVGGTALIVYAIVMVLGVQLLRRVDFHQQSNMVIAAVALAVGLLPILIPGFYDKFPGDVRILLGSGVAMGAFVAAFLNFVFHHVGTRRVDGAEGDITQVEHDEHHRPHPAAAPPEGMAGPTEVHEPASDTASRTTGVPARRESPHAERAADR
jgi:uracil-xanthine permease